MGERPQDKRDEMIKRERERERERENGKKVSVEWNEDRVRIAECIEKRENVNNNREARVKLMM